MSCRCLETGSVGAFCAVATTENPEIAASVIRKRSGRQNSKHEVSPLGSEKIEWDLARNALIIENSLPENEGLGM